MSSDCQCEAAREALKWSNNPRRLLDEGCKSATIIPFLERRTFTFSTLKPTVATASDMNVVLCPALCILDYYRVRLSVRVHSLSLSSGQSLRISLYGTLPSEEDPATDFDDLLTPLTYVDITSSTTAPSLTTATASDPDAYIKIMLKATQGSSMATLSAQLSACLVLRSS